MKSKIAAACIVLAGCATTQPPAQEPLPPDTETAAAAGTVVTPFARWLGRLLLRLAGNTTITIKVDSPPADK